MGLPLLFKSILLATFLAAAVPLGNAYGDHSGDEQKPDNLADGFEWRIHRSMRAMCEKIRRPYCSRMGYRFGEVWGARMLSSSVEACRRLFIIAAKDHAQ